MNIRNYTSNVAVENTLARIEAKLANAGASGIFKNYGPDRQIISLVFQLTMDDRHYQIKVPANVEGCYQALLAEHRRAHPRMRSNTERHVRDQAARTAWKLVQDWIEVQLSMIIMKQAEWREVFMPYIWNGEQTFFELVKSNGYKALPEKI